tara:strand:+ start:681 stop:872 length:192 start_codon:yes stop_codon:yes gene_type:complete
MEDLNIKLDRIESKCDEILELLRPVHAHAAFVDDLKQTCYSTRFIRSLMPTPREAVALTIEDA